MVCVVSGILYGDIPEQTSVCTKHLVGPILRLPPLTEHAPYPTILCPWYAAQEEVTGHVLQSRIH